MRAKKELRNSADFKEVIIEEDLTAMRRRLVSVLQSTGPPDRKVWTIDGKVCAKEQTSGGGERSVTVQTYRDFRKLQLNNHKCEFIGLYSM